MRIHELRIKNLMGIAEITIEPFPGINVIAGSNGNGKTSLLDAIYFGLAGEAAQKDIKRPIKDGEDEAEVSVDMGEFTVVRKWKLGKTSEVSVYSKDGAKYSKPRAFLDEKLGALSFDPLAFTRMDNKVQLKTLLDLVELPFDPGELASTRAKTYDDRSEINRQLKNEQALLSGTIEPDWDLPGEEVSVSSLVAQLREAEETIDDYNSLADKKRMALENAESYADEIKRLTLRMAEAKQLAESAQVKLDDFGPLPDLSAIEARIDSAEDTNTKVRAAKERAKIEQNVKELEAESERLTNKLKELDTVKVEGLQSAKMPIEGLAFDDDGVIFNGMPLSQCCSAEKLDVSVAMGIALNPTIRIMRIEDGPLLDAGNLQKLAETAEKTDTQIFVERIEEGTQQGFIIRDGRVENE